jgi:hypothetical protein
MRFEKSKPTLLCWTVRRLQWMNKASHLFSCSKIVLCCRVAGHWFITLSTCCT